MTRIVRVSFLVIAPLLCGAAVFAQGPSATNAQSQNASVSGKVTLNGKPMIGVTVLLTLSQSPPTSNAPRAVTDQTGLYRISDVKPDSYQIAVMAPGYVVSDWNTRPRMLVLSPGDTAENVDFSMVRGGVITGKVSDSEGKPVVEQQVLVYRADSFNENHRSPVYQTASGTTDDRGIYRIFGIAAGEYKVAVGRSDSTPQSFGIPGHSLYQQVFYPNVNDAAKAQVIEVSEGSEATGIDITVGPSVQTFSVSGRVIDVERNTPVPNVQFGLQRIKGEQAQFLSSLAGSNSKGEFLVENLIAGHYRVLLFPGMSVDNNFNVEGEFDIVDQDLTGVMVKVSKGASISGVVVLESEDKRAQANFSDVRVTAYVSGAEGVGGMGRSSYATVGPDGSFTITGLPAGQANIAAYSNNNRNKFGWIVTRIERDGVVLNRAIEIKDGEQITGVRLIMAYGSSTLRGVVNLINGEISADRGRIAVRLNRLGGNSFMRSLQVDARGHFIAEGLVPGDYEVFASCVIPNMKPRFTKQQVTVTSGIATDVVVTLDLAPDPKP